MKSDISRETFQASNKYTGVRLQQGRALVDADWNEQGEIRAYQDRRAASDAIGESGAPADNPGLAIAAVGGGTDLEAAAGRYYIEGIALQSDQSVPFTAQPDQPGYALPTDDGVYLAYAVTREALVTAVQDAELLDPALGGFDTTTRSRSLLQLGLLRDGNVGDVPDCLAESAAWTAFRDGERSANRARMKARLAPNATTGQAGEYTGEQNALYRVEIHKGGAPGVATYKWSRANAAEVLEWTAQAGDVLSVRSATGPRRGFFAPGDWLEVLDERFELTGRSGGLVQILADDGDTLRIKADSYTAFEGGSATLDISEYTGALKKLRRWSMFGDSGELQTSADAAEFLAIEHGIEIAFTSETDASDNADFRAGEAWLIPARTIPRDIEWSVQNASDGTNDFIPPMFPRPAFARLAYVQRSGGVWSVLGDCRRIFPTLADANLAYHSGDGQEGLPGEFLDEAVVVRVASGSVPVCDARVRFTIVAGDTGATPAATLEDVLDAANTGASVDVLTDAEGLAAVRWRIDSTTAQPRVTATLLDSDGTPTSLSVDFNAGLSVASRLQHTPDPVLDPNGQDLMAGVTTVRAALDALEDIKADRAGDTITGSLTVDEDLTVEGELTVQGDVIAKDLAQTPGDVVLGDQDSDRITIHGELKSEHITDAVVVDDSMQIREDLLVDGAIGPRSGIGIGEITGDWKYRVAMSLASPISDAPFSRRSQQVYASDAKVDASFGSRFAVHGNWMMVADASDSSRTGAVYAFQRVDGQWVERQKIIASDSGVDKRFGMNLAIEGNLLVVGSHPENANASTGSVYVFELNDGEWREIQQAVPSDAVVGDQFGAFVAISGTTVLAGSPRKNGFAGAAYAFRVVGGVLQEEAKMTPPAPASNDIFGNVAVDGDTAVISAYGRNQAFVYQRVGQGWVYRQTLSGVGETWFGISVAIDGNQIAIGAPYESGNTTDEGATYVFEFDGSTWNQAARISALDGHAANRYGLDVDISGDTVLVGARGNNNVEGTEAGAVYVLKKDGGGWSQEAKFILNDDSAFSGFGHYVQLHEDVAYVSNAASNPSAAPRHRAGSLTVVPRTPDALINYQHELTLNTAQLVNAGKMKADGSDILFMNADDLIPLPYWIESGMNTAATKIWVRLPAIPAGGSTRIFLHYGNENASPRSSTADTFMGEIEDLSAAWQIEEGVGNVVRDLSGNGNDGAMQGPVVWSDGRFESALDFNGSNNIIDLPAGSFFPPSDIGSVSMWFYTDTPWASLDVRTAWRFTAGAQVLLLFWDRSGVLSLNMSFRNGRHVSVPVDLQALVGRWNHLVCTYDGGDKNSGSSFRYFLNGIDLGPGTIDTGEVGDNFGQNDNVIGSDAQSGSSFQFWNGRLNHLQIFQRVLLPEEIAGLSRYYGYATLENPGRILLRTHAETAPVVAVENELPVPFALPKGWQYRKSISIQNDFPESFSEARLSLSLSAASTILAEAGDQLLVGSFQEGNGVVRVLERDAAGFYTEVQSFTGSGLTAGAGFGGSIAVDGDRAAIGASGQNSGQGMVFVYERSNGVWYESAQLVGDAPGDANLGGDVAIAGDYIFGGGESPSQSQARVFYKNPTSGWSQTQLLTTSESNPADRAWQLAADGEVAIVGAINNIEGGSHVGGAVFVFRLDHTTGLWLEVQKLTPSVRAAGDRFGIFPSMHGNTLLIGADEASIGNGAAYVFEFEDGRWVETAKLTDPDGSLGDRFGFRTRVSRDTIVAGSEFKHLDGFSDVGAAFVFTRTGSGWTPGIEVKAGDFSRDNLFFGYDVEIVGDSIFASTFPSTGVGEVFQFERLRPQSIDDVQIAIELDTTALIADRKLNLQGDDFLITDEDGLTPLPHFLEVDGLNSRATKIWARVPGLRAGASKQIFLHYGNPDAHSHSSASETFVRVVDGIAAAYSFDSITKARIFDDSGNGNDGVSIGGPVFVPGVFGTALDFDGFNDVVDFGDTVSTKIQGDITLSCWFRCDGVGTGTDSAGNAMLIGKNRTANSRSYSIDISHANGRVVQFNLYSSGDTGHALASNTPIEYGKWYHLVGTYDRTSGNQQIYLNGVLDAEQSIGQIDLQQTAQPLLLGAQLAASGVTRRHFLDGALDQPRIYARSLSAEEVRDLSENRGDAFIAGYTRSEMVRRSLRPTLPVLPDPTEDRIAYEFPESWSVRQAIRIDNRAAVSTNFTKLSAANLDDLDYLGGQVFIGDDFAFAGAIGDDELGSEAGAVYVYRREAEADGEDRWLFDTKLTASDGAASHVFGANLSFDGVSLIVTAQGGGRSYIFVRENGAWTEQAILTPSGSASSFGYHAWVDGDLAVVGDHSSDVASTDAGAAYVFRRTGTTWSEEAILSHPNPSPSIFFGSAVSVSRADDRIAVGCRGDGGSSVNRGAVYLFDFDGSTWQRGAELVADDAANGDQLGESMGMSGDTVVAGAYLKNSSTGAAYVFRQSGEGWVQEAKLTASDGAAGDELAVEIAISGDRILAGARQPANGPGKAYLFRRDERNNWIEERILKGDGTINGFLFGTVVSISEQHALVGHRADGVQILSRGAAYLFELSAGETDVQTELSIDTAALIAAGQMQSDCGDLLFTDADGRGRLAHWIESGINTADTKVWVRLPYLPYAQTKTIYMHSGNALARSRSSIADTFVREIDGVLAAYDFEEDSGTSIVDRSGNGFDGALQSGASRTAGKFGSALGLDGSGQYATLPAFPERDEVYDFTVSVWGRLDVLSTATGSAGRQYLFDFRGDSAAADDSIGMYLEHQGGGQATLDSFVIYDGSNYSASQNSVAIQPGVWYHYVLRRRGTEFVAFVNGEKLEYIPLAAVGVVPPRLDPVNFSHQKRLGAASADSAQDWHGALDALRIYDRALSDAEIYDASRNFSDVDPERSAREILRKHLDNPPLIETALDEVTRRIVPGDAANLDSFATGIGVSGDIVAVGSPDDDDDGSASGSGYLYRRYGDQFGLMQKVRPKDPAANARFGATAAVGGEEHQFAFFGARSTTTFPAPGNVYVFKRDRDEWSEHQKLQASSTTNTDGFGAGLAARGDYLAVGSPYHDQEASDGGAVFVYRREGDLFIEQDVLTSNDVEATDGSFGLGLEFNDAADVLVVGAYLKKESATAPGGAVYIFTRDGDSWSQQAKLISEDRAPGDNFGRWVSIDEDGKTVAIGANDEGAGGAVYIFENDPTQGWVQKLKLTADDGAGGDRFGQSVVLSGGTLAVGAGEDDTAQGTNSGSLYLYRRRSGDWVFEKKYVPEESAANAQYATRMAMDSEFIYAGNAPVGGTATALQSGVLFAIRHGSERRYFESRPPAQGWLYSEAIDLSAQIDAPITVTDYQIAIEIDTADAIARGRMQPDGRDIAFFMSDGVTELDHWIESGMNTATTKVWLKIPSISGGESLRVLLRYGFAEGVSRSSVGDTFVREIDHVRAAYVLDAGDGATVADASGNGNAATIVGAVATGGPAVDQSALLFDGLDDYVLIPNNPQLDVADNLTLSARFRCDGPGTGADGGIGSFIISREHSSSDSAYALLIRHGTRRLDFELWSPGLSVLTSNAVLNYGQWYHVACTYDPVSGEARLYIDGQLDHSDNFGTLSIATPDRSALLGAYFGSADETVVRGFLNGAISQAGIYAQTFTAAEVADQYANASLFVAPRPGRELIRKTAKESTDDSLIALNFNEGAGVTAADASGNGNDATLNGATWDTAGIAGAALRFDGVNNYARTPVSWPAIGTGDFTIYAWINLDAIHGDHRMISVDQAGNNFQFLIGNEGGIAPSALEMYLGGSATLKSTVQLWKVDRWYHVCAKRENGVLYFFLNGQPIGSVSAPNSIAASSFLDIGYRSVDGQHPFGGRIDEFRIYDRALSDTEVLRASGNPGLPLNTAVPVTVETQAERFAVDDSGARGIGESLAVPVAWNYRQAITIDNTAGGALADYQQLLVIDTATLVREGKLHADLRDLLFVDSDNSSELNYWIESGANSEATRIWVKIPIVPASGQRTIFMYYGNRATRARSSVSGVFVREIPGLTMALQMDEGAGTTLLDSSGNANTLDLISVPWVAGNFSSAISLNGTTGYAIRNPYAEIPANEITLEFWMRSGNTSRQGALVSYKLDPNPTGIDELTFTTNAGVPGYTFQTNNNTAVGGAVLSDDAWHHVAVTWRGSDGEVVFYKDGVETSRDIISAGYALPAGGALVLGQEQDSVGGGFDPAQSYEGLIEGLRIYDRVLTAEEVADAAANYAFATPQLPGRTLVRSFAAIEPLVAQGAEEEAVFTLLNGPYRRPINIDRENETESLADYQALLTLDTAALIAENKAAPDLSDLSFTADDGETQLPFWIESGSGTANTRIWIRIPRIPAGEISNIYMYYGERGRGGESSAKGTMLAAIDGVAAAYSFDEGAGTTVADLSGNGNTGTLTNGPLWTAGQRGGALLFDGQDDYVTIPTSPLVSLTTNITLAAWIRVDGPGTGLQSGPVAYLINKHHTNTNESYATYFNHATRQIVFQVFEAGNITHELTSNRVFIYGQWIFMTGTYNNATGDQRLYFDGVLDASQNEGSFNIAQTTLSVTIGAFFQTPETELRSFLNGAIDEPRIYDAALTPSEVEALYRERSFILPDYPGREFVRRAAVSEPALAVGGEEQFPFTAEQEGWPYRIPVTVDNSVGSNALNDFQIAVTINTLGPIAEGKMQADGRDILVTDADAITPVPFWIEGPINSAQTKLWVRLPAIAANSQKTIYVFYGNAQATALSNRGDVFVREVPNVIAGYAMDDVVGNTLPDLSGNGYDGTIDGATPVAGRLGQALSFDGENDFVELPAFGGSEATVNDFTIGLWVNLIDHNPPPEGISTFLDLRGSGYNPAAPESIFMKIHNTGSDIEVHHGIEWPTSPATWTEYATPIADPVGQWTQFIFARSGSETRVYVDGVRLADTYESGSQIVPPQTDPIPFSYTKRLGTVFGAVPSTDGHWTHGLIEGLRFYDRALTDEEITDLFQERGHLTLQAPGVELVRKFAGSEPLTSAGLEENIPYQENSVEIRLSIDGIIESRSGGFRFPDGTVQVSASADGAVFPAAYGLLNESPYAPDSAYQTNGGTFKSAVDFADWTERAKMPFVVRAHSSVALDGRLHVLGGRTEPGTLRADHLRYDPQSDDWQVLTPMNNPRQYTRAVELNGRIHIIGGLNHFSNITAMTSHEVYDPSSNAWQVAEPLPEPLHTTVTNVTPDGLIHVIGGRGNTTTYLDVHYVYSPEDNAWYTAAPMPTARGTMDAVVDDAGRIHVIGGYDGNISVFRAEHEVYDPGTDSWHTAAPLPIARHHHRMFLIGDSIYLFGGLVGQLSPGSAVQTVDVYNLRDDSWSTIPGGPVSYEFAASRIGDTIYVTGGLPDIGQPTSDRTLARSFARPIYMHQRVPVPSAGGAVTTVSVTSDSVTLRWEAAATSGLNYRVFYSHEANLRSPDEIERNGIPVGAGEVDAGAIVVPGLATGAHYFNVLVEGMEGTRAAYEMTGPIWIA